MNINAVVAIASSLLLWGGVGAIAEVAAQAQSQVGESNQDILFRTKRYVVQIYWRGDRPYMSVGHNGMRVIANAPAYVAAKRGAQDTWTTYICRSGDYFAIVRVDPNGRRMIEVTLDGKTVAKEYATAAAAQSQASQIRQRQSNQSQVKQKPSSSTVLAFQTDEYAVHVYRQQSGLYLNLYNRKSAATELNRVAVKQIATSDGTAYRYDGDSTVQVRDYSAGERSLIILRDNEVQYRGVGY